MIPLILVLIGAAVTGMAFFFTIFILTSRCRTPEIMITTCVVGIVGLMILQQGFNVLLIVRQTQKQLVKPTTALQPITGANRSKKINKLGEPTRSLFY